VDKSRKPKQKPDDKAQSHQFIKAARELGADPDEGRFQDALRTVAKHKPSARPEGKKERPNNRRG